MTRLPPLAPCHPAKLRPGGSFFAGARCARRQSGFAPENLTTYDGLRKGGMPE